MLKRDVFEAAYRVESGARPVQARKARRQQSRANHQHERQRYFGRHHDARQFGLPLVSKRGALAVLHLFAQIARGGAQGGQQSNQQSGNGGRQCRKRKHAQIKRRVDMRLRPAAQQHHGERPADQGSNRQACRGARNRDQETLHQQLLHEPAPRSAHRHPGGQFLLARRSPRHQQAGEVHTSKQKDSAAHRKHRQQRLAEELTNIGESG